MHSRSDEASSVAASPSLPPHDVLRVLVVGETGVGKTLLLQRLCHEVFAPHATTTTATAASNSNDDDDDDDNVFLRTHWPPTIGFGVDALLRSTSAPLVLRAAAEAARQQQQQQQRYVSSSSVTTQTTRTMTWHDEDDVLRSNNNSGSGGVRQRRVAMASSSGSGGSSSVVAVQASASSRLQAVEFHELGATRTFGSAFRLPLQLMTYDGIMLVYERSNGDSAAYLHTWYARMRQLYTQQKQQQQQDVDGAAGADVYEATLPKLMLVGTQLRPAARKATAATTTTRTAAAAMTHMRYDAQQYSSTGAWLLDDVAAVQNTRTTTATVLLLLLRRLWRCVTRVWCVGVGVVQLLCEVVTLLLHPSTLLSPMYVEEYVWRGHRNAAVRTLRRVVVAVASLLTLLQHATLLAMAVVLFGPRHEMVSQSLPLLFASSSSSSSLSTLLPLLPPVVWRERDALARIRRDAQCIAHAHDCQLYSSAALQPALDELLAFFDRLHHDKLLTAAVRPSPACGATRRVRAATQTHIVDNEDDDNDEGYNDDGADEAYDDAAAVHVKL